MSKKAQAGVRGKFIPRWVGAPSGGRMGKGCARQAPSSRRANGAYRARPWAGRGAASSEQADRQMVGSPLGGARARGAHDKPHRPVGRRGLSGAPLGGAGENCSRQGYCAPELRGRRGLTSSICVISARANIYRISPLFGLWLIMEPRGFVFRAASTTGAIKTAKSQGVSVIVFSDCSPLAKGEHEEKRLFGQTRHMCPRITGAE